MSVTSTPTKGIVSAASSAIKNESSTVSANTWTQLIASTSTPILVLGFGGSMNGAGTAIMDIGTGAAASEVIIGTTYAAATTASAHTITPLRFPLRIAAGTRVAMRSTNALPVSMLYVSEGSVR